MILAVEILNKGSHSRFLFLWLGPSQEARSVLYLNYMVYSCGLASFLSVILLEAENTLRISEIDHSQKNSSIFRKYVYC